MLYFSSASLRNLVKNRPVRKVRVRKVRWLSSHKALSYFLGLCLLSLLSFGIISPAFASSDSAEDSAYSSAQLYISEFLDQGMQLLRKKNVSQRELDSAIRKMVADYFDVPMIARFVIGPAWRNLNPEQREKYEKAYFDYVVVTYLSRVADFGAVDIISQTSQTYAGSDILVSTELASGDDDRKSLKVGWRVRQRDGSNELEDQDNSYKLKILDILVEGISLAVTQRSEFRSILSAQGYHGLMEAMRVKTEDIQLKRESAFNSETSQGNHEAVNVKQ